MGYNTLVGTTLKCETQVIFPPEAGLRGHHLCLTLEGGIINTCVMQLAMTFYSHDC